MNLEREREQVEEERSHKFKTPIYEYERKKKFTVTEHYCPEGYHWVSWSKDGSRKGHCAKNPKKRFPLF